MRFILFLTTFFYLPAVALASELTFTESHREVYLHYLRLEFENGHELLLEATDPENGNTLYLKSYYEWFHLLINGREATLETFEKTTEERLSTWQHYDESSPYFRFLQAELYLHLGTAQLFFEQRWSAVWNIRRAYKLLQKNQEQHPDFLDNYKSLGLLEVIFGAVPDKYQWALSLIGLKGTIRRGVQKLQKLHESESVFGIEAGMVLAMLQTHVLGQEQEAARASARLHQEHPDVRAVDFVRTITLLRAQDHAGARAFLMRRKPSADEYPLPHWAYMRAEAELHLGNFEAAKPFYQNFLGHYKGQHFIKDTYYKLFLAEWLGTGKENEAWLRKVRTAGKALTDADRHALRFAERKSLPHPKLMEARLLTDGGSYQKAMTLVDTLTSEALSEEDRTEWWYRKARILHQQHKVAKAVPAYLETIERGAALPNHFAANASLQLGYIFARRGEKARARKYFEQVADYDNHAYRESLKQKAKAGLRRLEEE